MVYQRFLAGYGDLRSTTFGTSYWTSCCLWKETGILRSTPFPSSFESSLMVRGLDDGDQSNFNYPVAESLFSMTASNERKFWGFTVFEKALPRVKATDLPMLFTKNFMRTWINHLSHPDRYLHSFAKQIASPSIPSVLSVYANRYYLQATDILSVVQKEPSLGFAFVLQLTGTHGNQQFDKLTKTRTVESILTMTNAEGIKNYIAHLLGQVDGDANPVKYEFGHFRCCRRLTEQQA